LAIDGTTGLLLVDVTCCSTTTRIENIKYFEQRVTMVRSVRMLSEWVVATRLATMHYYACASSPLLQCHKATRMMIQAVCMFSKQCGGQSPLLFSTVNIRHFSRYKDKATRFEAVDSRLNTLWGEERFFPLPLRTYLASVEGVPRTLSPKVELTGREPNFD
jgi:hypothetical protein